MLHSSLPRFNFDETKCGSWSHLCKADFVFESYNPRSLSSGCPSPGLFSLCYGVLDYQDLGDCSFPRFSSAKNRITSDPSIQIEIRIDHGGGTGSPNQPVDCSTREAMNVLTAIFGEFTSSVSTMATYRRV